MFQVIPLYLPVYIDVDVKTGDLWVGADGNDYLALKNLIPPHKTVSPIVVNTTTCIFVRMTDALIIKHSSCPYQMP